MHCWLPLTPYTCTRMQMPSHAQVQTQSTPPQNTYTQKNRSKWNSHPIWWSLHSRAAKEGLEMLVCSSKGCKLKSPSHKQMKDPSGIKESSCSPVTCSQSEKELRHKTKAIQSLEPAARWNGHLYKENKTFIREPAFYYITEIKCLKWKLYFKNIKCK